MNSFLKRLVELFTGRDNPKPSTTFPASEFGRVPANGHCAIKEVRELVEDIDGNTYRTVQIGDQVWMAENLRTTRYRNGDEIPYARTDRAWGNEWEGMRCAYKHDEKRARTYGQLYNWLAVADERGLCPEGWHVPSDEEWNALERALGLSSVDARQEAWRGIHAPALKSKTWDGTDVSGFSALPGGQRDDRGSFDYVGYSAYFWSSSPRSLGAWFRRLGSRSGTVFRNDASPRVGFSVRCVRD